MPKVAVLGLALLLTGCSGRNSPQILLIVAPSDAKVHVSNHQQFTATIQNSANQSVRWSVSGEGCGKAGCGSIKSNGVYTAPAAVPRTGEVRILARAFANLRVWGSATVKILPAVTVTVSPVAPNVRVRGSQQFTAIVRNASNSAVSWTVNGTGCHGEGCGTVDANGLYTAPSALPSPGTVTVTATSVEDPSRFDSAAVMIVAVMVSGVPPEHRGTPAGTQQFPSATELSSGKQAETDFAQGRGALCGCAF